MTYIPFACDCVRWASTEDLKQYHDSDSLAPHSVYIEPATETLILPDSLMCIDKVIRFEGEFYQKHGFPEGHMLTESSEKSRVFRYHSYEIVKKAP